MAQEVLRRKRGYGRRTTWPSGNDETDENVESMKPLARIDRRLGIRMIVEMLNMDKETARQILTTNLNKKRMCTKMVPKNLAVFSRKTNTNARTRSLLTRSRPCNIILFPELKSSLIGTHFQSTEDIHKTAQDLLKALSQNGLK
jgi:hypothetical protein